MRGADTVARFGGDEFIALLTDITNLQHVAILAQNIVDELARPFVIGAHNVTISCSIGIALYPRDATTPEELVRHADNAMCGVKRDGRNSFAFFTPEMRAAASGRMKLIGELRTAMPGGQLRVCYQPVVELGNYTMVGAEAQVRWQHPVLGLLTAEQFIGLAEEAGLAGAIDEWVLSDVLARACAWQLEGGMLLLVSMHEAGLASQGESAHWEATLDTLANLPSPVALEITETALRDTRSMGARLTGAGVQLCLDDFGAGQSSMSSLAMVPLMAIKIDPSLVRQLDQDAPRAVAAGHHRCCPWIGRKSDRRRRGN